MDRLTDKRFVGDGFYQPKSHEEWLEIFANVPKLQDIYDRLARYEDTGLTPDDISAFVELCKKVSEPKGEITKIKILLDREEVFEAVERITNEAIEKGLRKSTIQKSLILGIGALKPAKIEYEYENYDPSGVGQTFSP